MSQKSEASRRAAQDKEIKPRRSLIEQYVNLCGQF
jgi:hypothetical protein